MRLACLFFFFFVVGIASVQAQRFLQMERVGSFKVKRYYAGDEVTFKLKGDDYWYTESILEIMIPENLVLFANRAVKVEDITHLRSFKMRSWSKPFGRQLYNFGLGWIVYSIGDLLFGNPFRTSTYMVPLSAGALGFLIQKLFRQRTFKMGKSRRLRLLDITFSPGP